MLHRLLRYFSGGLRLELRGPRVAEFMNLALSEGILLWDVVATEEAVRLTLPPGRLWELRPLARATRTRVRSIGRQGLPFRLMRVRKRYVLLAGVLVVLAAIWWASGHIWLIEVRGTSMTDPRAVKAAAQELGLRSGVWRERVDLQAIQRDLPTQVGSITWSAIRLQGVRAIITVVEKRQPTIQPQTGRLDLVAAKPGTVVQVVALAGQALVKPGDAVQAGQPLISGQLLVWSGGRPLVMPGTAKPPRETVAKEMPAQGYIRARVTYNLQVEVPRVRVLSEPSIQSRTLWRLKWGQKEILLGKKPPPPEPGQEARVQPLENWRIPGLPVEVKRERHDWVRVRTEPLPEATVLDAARQQVMSRLLWSLPADSQVESVHATIQEEKGQQAVVQVRVVTIENIGQPMPPTGAQAQP